MLCVAVHTHRCSHVQDDVHLTSSYTLTPTTYKPQNTHSHIQYTCTLHTKRLSARCKMSRVTSLCNTLTTCHPSHGSVAFKQASSEICAGYSAFLRYWIVAGWSYSALSGFDISNSQNKVRFRNSKSPIWVESSMMRVSSCTPTPHPIKKGRGGFNRY